jgi:hypothetical protein
LNHLGDHPKSECDQGNGPQGTTSYLNGDHPKTETIPNKRANSTGFYTPIDFCTILGFYNICVSGDHQGVANDFGA